MIWANARAFERYVKALVDAGFCVLAFDLYGHGATDAPDMELTPMAFVGALFFF